MLSKIIIEYTRSKGYILSVIFICLLLVETGLTVLIPVWRGVFYGIIEHKQADLVIHAALLFVLLIGALVIAQSLKTWIKALIGLDLRKIITDMLLTRWNNSVTIERNKLSFPDQRINEDAKLCTIQALGVVSECMISALIVIWLLTTINNNMLILYSIGYSLTVMALTIFFHNPMVKADIQLQIAEASQRTELAKMVQRNIEWEGNVSIFPFIVTQYKKYMSLLLGYNIFNGLQTNLTILVPFIILLPQYFVGSMTLGDLMQDIASFELIVLNATILLNMYPQFINMNAAWSRVITFYKD